MAGRGGEVLRESGVYARSVDALWAFARLE